MAMARRGSAFVVLFLSALLPSLASEQRFYFGNTSAGLSTRWTNNPYTSSYATRLWSDNNVVTTIFRGQLYACGFFCSGSCRHSYFAVYSVQAPQVMWTANRNSTLEVNSTLELTSDGDLVLKHADGSIAWSSNTSGKSVVGVKLTEAGNLQLFDRENEMIWQSFDHPTDVLLPGQKLWVGQKLIPSVGDSNFSEFNLLSFSITSGGLTARTETDPPQIYYYRDLSYYDPKKQALFMVFLNGTLALALPSNSSGLPDIIPFSYFLPPSPAQFLRFSSDGHLREYRWKDSVFEMGRDYFTIQTQDCGYPLVCGVYGICSNGQCSCPVSTNREGMAYFKAVNDRQPNLGCTEVTSLSCETPQDHSFVELKGVGYFDTNPNLPNVSSERCKEECLSNCSCKAAFFYKDSSQYGDCTLHSRIFSLMDAGDSKHIAYIKVQDVALGHRRRANRLPVILGSGLAFLILLGAVLYIFLRKKECADESGDRAEDYLDQVPGVPSRFSYDDLRAWTGNFNKKLGEGGFGSVFEGILPNGTKVAVKHLYSLGQTKDSFLTEVKVIASIHHVNLVRLVGFCAEKSQRLLVYEYMANGSLDRWIFRKDNGSVLEWPRRKKVILDIARGLNYLHEDCSQKIIHLDIKPQNVLLDENLNAKVCDFGLSKLVERDQSQFMTTMRGTPGYLAPEWLNAAISEKVDVYSFGVVILEMVCGRRVLSNLPDGDDRHLPSLFKRKTDEKRLMDIIDKCCHDVPQHRAEAMDMMKLAAWCLQGNYEKRPSMSMVIKVLDGVLDVEDNIDCNFWNQNAGISHVESVTSAAAPLLPSVLSGPR